MFQLLNFDVKVSGNAHAGYTVDAIDPDREPATAPFDWASVQALAPDLAAIERGAPDREILERVGQALFSALFSGEVRDLFVAVQARLGQDEGLRLRLCFPAELSRLPWELLHFHSFLALNPRRTVVRFLDLPGQPSALAARPPLRLLHLIANPVETPPLDVEREREQLNSALADLVQKRLVEILPCPAGTLAVLQDGLREGCHFLHFSGHGSFEGGKGYLLFEDDDGHERRVDGKALAYLLQGTDTRLALLNACESARAGAGDAFGGVAAALIGADLPAVIAHQYAMPDSSAIPFAAEFYRALADGYPVDAAVSEGRKAIFRELGSNWGDSIDWATPVLFMRPPDGRILDWGEAPAAATAPSQPAAPTFQIDSIRGERLDLFSHTVLTAPPSPPPPVDPLPGLLDELRNIVRDLAPEEKRPQALEKMATLRGAATERRPNLAVLESVWQWFDAELPALSGAVLSAILGVKPRLEELADDHLLLEFRQRFETFF